ncbi:hypothetical protein DL770_006314 [Monosporascus sp. CRB-9-2]|nr:hypothetical protein DL770_006314 [Monosporascus sp. CRB-9-2]
MAEALPKYKTDFLHASLAGGALRFGTFELKSGRTSPYFFDAGLFYKGPLHVAIVDAFASTIQNSQELRSGGGGFDIVFGPAYKGIPLATGVVYALTKQGGSDKHPGGGGLAYTFDRKEVKDHGEGGMLVGAPMEGKRVLIIDDVVSSGTAKRHAVDMIRAAGGVVAGIVVALDRQETVPGGDGKTSALGELRRSLGVPVVAIVKLDDIITGMRGAVSDDDIRRIEEYRSKYGASD